MSISLMLFICLVLVSPAVAIEYGYYEYHATEDLNDIDGTSDQSIWAVGDQGLIIHYDGTSWQEEESGTTVDLISVAAVDTTHSYALGSGVCLYRDGSQWQTISGISGGIDVAALPSGEAWISVPSAIYYYDGTNWSPMKLSIQGTIQSFSVVDSDNIWIFTCKETQENGGKLAKLYV